MTDVYNDGTYYAANPDWHVGDSPWKAGQIIRIIQKNSLSLKTVCEIGCGAGEVIRQLADRMGSNIEFTGFEVSDQAYRLCLARERDNVHYFCKDLLRENIAAPFDLVLAIDVFEHVRDYLGFLADLREKGRYKIFHIPLDLCAQMVFRGRPIMEKRKRVGHLHYFFKDTAIATLVDSGYKIIDYCYTGSSLSAPKIGVTAAALRIPRQLLFSVSPDLTARVLGGYSLLVLSE